MADKFLVHGAEAIMVWPWANAPSAMRQLSTVGGREDWVAYVPPCYENEWRWWITDSPAFDFFDVQDHQYMGGTVLIGSYS